MMEEIVHETSRYAFVLYWLQETYHIRPSSITQDDICVCNLIVRTIFILMIIYSW
jgi:hypothetical protein